MKVTLVIGCLLALAQLAGCSNSTGPTAAILNVTLSSPNTDDGAVLFTISGGPVDSVEALGHTLYTARQDAETLRLIVLGNIGSGLIARIHVPDSRQVSRYSARIGQVAARGTYAQRNPGPYSARLVP